MTIQWDSSTGKSRESRCDTSFMKKLMVDGWSLDVLGEFKKVLYASESWEGERKTLILRHDTDLISLVELVDG